MGTLKFVRNFINDRNVASVTPTSRRCVAKVCSHIDFSKDILVVEYGPGDGVFSRYLLDKMSPGSRIVMIERNKNFAEYLRESIPDPRAEVFNLLADDAIGALRSKDVGNVDYVLSGIPFSFLKPARKMDVLESTKTMLREGGKFLAYQTSGHLKKPLMKAFGNLETEWEMLNIPPCIIYDVTKNGG